VDSVPDHPPEAVQEVALAEDHDNVDAEPLVTLLGFALKFTVGDGDPTETIADCDACRPSPSQVSV